MHSKNTKYFKYRFLIFIFLYNVFNSNFYAIKKRIGVIGLDHSQNVGNNLVKYAISIKLSEFGYIPYIIGKRFRNHNISFINSTVNLILIKNFSEIKESDFDILMVNSDQTWNVYAQNFYDIAFLKFAENWEKPKFVYGTSLGFDSWKFNKTVEKVAKKLVKKFIGISVREKVSVDLIKKHLDFNAIFVLDPTLLINKKYYLNLIKNYQSDIMREINNEQFIFAYILKKTNNLRKYLSHVKKKLKLPIFYVTIGTKDQVKEFLYGINKCKAVITNSFHGTVFSIIFNKPFVTFKILKDDSRLNNLIDIFNIGDRIIDVNSIPPISLLKKPLTIDKLKLNSLRKKSLNYLRKNLYYSNNFF